MDINKIINSRLQNNFSKIIHMAALSDVDYCNLNPSKCYELNVNGTQKMLEIARKKDAEFVFLSSSHVYGNSKKYLFLKLNQVHHYLIMQLVKKSAKYYVKRIL